MAQKLYFVAGEHSGDTRGAELMESLLALRPDWEFGGLGGPKMRERAGPGVVDWVEEAAVVGLWEVLKRYSWFKARFAETRRAIDDFQPAAVIFIDYPGFNLRLARALHESGASIRLIDYVSPGVGLEQGAHSEDGNLARSHALPLPLREGDLRGSGTPHRVHGSSTG